MKKIIHILPHSPSNLAYVDFGSASLPRYYEKTGKSPYWVGFFERDWHVNVARETLKRTDEYNIECWRLYDVAENIHTRMIDGITHRLFPSRKARKIHKMGRDFIVNQEYSSELIQELRKEITSGEVLLHLHGFPSRFNFSILKSINGRKVPIVIQNRGGCFRFQGYEFEKTIPFRSLATRILKTYELMLSRILLYKIDHFLMISKYQMDLLHVLGFTRTSIHKDGIDYNKFNQINKEEARRRLQLPMDKRILLYVGRFYSRKGVDKLIQLYPHLRDEYGIELLLVGGEEDQELFDMISKSGVMYETRIPKELLPDYYSAADASIFLMNPYVERFGGFGTAPIESMACGTPIIGRNLVHFPGSEEELQEVGVMPEGNELDQIEEAILMLLENSERFRDCRKVSRRYFDIKVTIQKNIDIYKRLFERYYGN